MREFSGLPNYAIGRTGDRVLAIKNLRGETFPRDVQVAVNWFDSLRRSSELIRDSPEPDK